MRHDTFPYESLSENGNAFHGATIPATATITMTSSSLTVAVTHLNAPVGPVLTAEDLAQALRSGSVASLNRRAAAIVSYLFIELHPSLIASCVAEAGSDLRRANKLYEEAVHAHIPRAPEWEKAVEHLV